MHILLTIACITVLAVHAGSLAVLLCSTCTFALCAVASLICTLINHRAKDFKAMLFHHIITPVEVYFAYQVQYITAAIGNVSMQFTTADTSCSHTALMLCRCVSCLLPVWLHCHHTGDLAAARHLRCVFALG